MKTTQYTLTIGAVALACAMTVATAAVEQPFSPKMYDVKPRVIQGTGVQNPNLLANLPAPNTRALAGHPVVAAGVKDADTLAMVKKCAMPPKTLDTSACKRMCEVAGIK